MAADRVTANLPSRDFDATAAFYAALGFDCDYRDESWMILSRGSLEIEFFPAQGLDPYSSWHGACIRVSDLDALWSAFQAARISRDPRAIPRLTPARDIRPGLRMFALVDCDGSLLRCLGKD